MPSPLENQKRRLLVVDDDPESLLITKKALEFENYSVETADSGQNAIDKMDSWKPHLVLLDVNMPNLNGLDTLKFLRKSHEYVSTIFVSGKSDTEDVIRGLDAGADDYICKPFDTKELLARVRAQLRIKELQDELKRANSKLKELVDIDDLTGLFNMRSLYSKLDHELQRARRYGRNVCVLMMDMDNFKKVNDGNDHLFGSFVLAEVGGIIRSNVRNIDFAARYGGDEFLIVLTEIQLEGAKAFSERLRKLIEEYEFKNDKHEMRLTSSLGFAITSPSNPNVDARTLVRYADRALYQAKERGKNCVHFYDFAQEGEQENDSQAEQEVLRKKSG